MQEATSATVLGNFDNATFSAYGVTSRFFKRDGRFYVNTEGADGVLRDYPVDYTFGVDPLQQYLVGFPDGRYQALGIAWDTRPSDQGGQRWFHLYPDERIVADDVLHWTGINQNWNYMCADCHTTDLVRNYDRAGDRFDTTWSEIGVACEACHGPAAKHVEWARSDRTADSVPDSSNGLVVDFGERKDVRWIWNDGAAIASRSRPPEKFRAEIETCGRCHARRAPLGDTIAHGAPLLDSYRVTLLEEDLYHGDGQIDDEVYVYGSFLQSKMYRAGVTCSDCHDPHTLKLRFEGDALCTQCHRSEVFATPEHHFHTTGNPGGRCVDCHAPTKTYMVVDPRRDHSFRVPRPDLTVKLGVPNACSGCHEDRSAAWAADRIIDLYGPDGAASPHFGETLAGARNGDAGAMRRLVRIASDGTRPAIVRATALETLGRNLNREGFAAIGEGLRSDDALVRLAALGTLEGLGPSDRFRGAFPLLTDPVRAVRLEAARLLAPVPLEELPADARATLEGVFEQIERALETSSDRPESLTTLGNFYRERGDVAKSESTYREVLSRHPSFAPAYVNLADLYRSLDRDDAGAETLRSGIETNPDNAALHYVYGLLLIRQQRYTDATGELARAAELGPDNARYGYVYALALQKIGDIDKALVTLRGVYGRHPENREVLLALATMHRDRGNLEDAKGYARTLVDRFPEDVQARQLLESLQAQ